MTDPSIASFLARADQLLAKLRDKTPGRGHSGCDALDPCEECKAEREEFRALQRRPADFLVLQTWQHAA